MNSPFDFELMKKYFHHSKLFYVICTDTEGNYSYINERYKNAFSHVSADILNGPYHITMHPDDVRVCEEVGAKCYTDPQGSFPATIRKHNGSGGYVVTEWEFRLMVTHEKIEGIFCIGTDVTELISTKNEVGLISDELNIKNQKLNEIAFEQSHLVRAPLSNILGLVKILKNLDFGVNHSNVVNMIDESSKRLDEVIKNTVQKVSKP